MLDQHPEFRDLQIRLAEVESRTVSGVPDTSIAQRFTNMHDRVDQVGRNIIDRIDKLDGRVAKVEVGLHAVRSEMAEGFSKIDARFEKIDARFEAMDARFEAIDARFEKIDARFEAIDARFEAIDARFEAIDARFEKIDARFEAMDARFEKIDGQFEAIKAMLLNLGAKASPN